MFEYTDPSKDELDDHELVVTFRFNNDVTAEEAVKQIDKLVSLADNYDDIQFTEHEYDLFVIGEEE